MRDRELHTTRTLKVLGFLLTYPTPQHQTAIEECRILLAQEAWISEKMQTHLQPFFEMLGKTSLLDLQESYVELFDRTPSLSLHLFEHIHGDSRTRGQALADLAMLYEESGLQITGGETPDYLPLFLEYLSSQPTEAAKEHIGLIVDILSAIGERLKNRDSSYALIFAAIKELTGRKPNLIVVEKALQTASGAASDFETIDQTWAEQFAFEQTQGSNRP